MATTPQQGWWLASDGQWYPPTLAPGQAPEVAHVAEAPQVPDAPLPLIKNVIQTPQVTMAFRAVQLDRALKRAKSQLFRRLTVAPIGIALSALLANFMVSEFKGDGPLVIIGDVVIAMGLCASLFVLPPFGLIKALRDIKNITPIRLHMNSVLLYQRLCRRLVLSEPVAAGTPLAVLIPFTYKGLFKNSTFNSPIDLYGNPSQTRVVALFDIQRGVLVVGRSSKGRISRKALLKSDPLTYFM